MTITNDSKNTLAITNTDKRTNHTWNDDLGTWDEQKGTWNVPKLVLNKSAKTTVSITNDNKN